MIACESSFNTVQAVLSSRQFLCGDSVLDPRNYGKKVWEDASQ